ncbi:MAG: ribosomal RNA small subunit methyltransferase I [Candidatus Parcubacteria bacterium]|nr:MAG: ribosomal RNA small subunit methyltransferase I [Candidatus Parcubacteria bacterium]
MTKLYVVPTPIGNLKDITLRALDVLNDVDYIFCEDTRRTKILLDYYKIQNKKLIPYFAPQEDKKIPQLIKIVKKYNSALVVDAGMPTISDPGYKLIKVCLKENIKIEVLPGSTAFLTALIGSGLPLDKFLFLGFLPKKGINKYFLKYKNFDSTIVFYDSPHRLKKNLDIIKEVFGYDTYVVIVKEISKIYEEYIRGNIEEIIKILNEKLIKGEITVVIRKKFKLI